MPRTASLEDAALKYQSLCLKAFARPHRMVRLDQAACTVVSRTAAFLTDLPVTRSFTSRTSSVTQSGAYFRKWSLTAFATSRGAVLSIPKEAPERGFPVVHTDLEERDAQFSPDGRWIAYDSDETGRFEVYVQPFMRPGARITVSLAGGTQVRWSDDFKELFYIAPDSHLMAVPIRLSPDHRMMTAGLAKPLFDTRTWGGLPGQGNYRQQYVVSRDGHRFLVHSIVSEEAAPITVVLNWRGKP